MKRNVTKRAGHPDPIGSNEFRVLRIGKVAVVTRSVPLLPRCLVEVRICKEAETDDAGRLSIDGRVGPVGLRRDRAVDVETELIRFRRLTKPRLVD